MPLFGKDKDNADKNVTLSVQTTSVTTTVSSSPARAEEVFGKQLVTDTTAYDRADKIRMLNRGRLSLKRLIRLYLAQMTQ